MSKPKKVKSRVSEPAAVGEGQGGEESGARPAAPSTSPRKEPAKKAKAQRTDVKDRIGAVVGNTGQFLREVRIELTKVSWPSRKDVIASTSVVLVIVFLIAAFLGLVDMGLSKIIKFVLS